MIVSEKKRKSELVANHLEKAMDYITYRALVAEHVEKGTSSGPEQSEALTNYTLLNHTRMKRLDKTVRISEEIQNKFKSFKGRQTWLVITESWCGDAAQSMPAMNALAELTPGIDVKVVLRDDNLPLMDAFLTQGSRSIPKLIVWDHETKQVTADWGPRPSKATKMVIDFKAEYGRLTPEFKQDLQVWYNRDKTHNIVEDLAQLID